MAKKDLELNFLLNLGLHLTPINPKPILYPSSTVIISSLLPVTVIESRPASRPEHPTSHAETVPDPVTETETIAMPGDVRPSPMTRPGGIVRTGEEEVEVAVTVTEEMMIVWRMNGNGTVERGTSDGQTEIDRLQLAKEIVVTHQEHSVENVDSMTGEGEVEVAVVETTTTLGTENSTGTRPTRTTVASSGAVAGRGTSQRGRRRRRRPWKRRSPTLDYPAN